MINYKTTDTGIMKTSPAPAQTRMQATPYSPLLWVLGATGWLGLTASPPPCAPTLLQAGIDPSHARPHHETT